MQHHIGSVNSTRAHPPPPLLAFVVLSGVGHLPIIIQGVNILPFRYFTSKYACFDNYRFSVKIIFNPYALKICVWFSLHCHPSPQYFLHPSKKLLPAIVISSHMEQKISASFEEFKGKETFLLANG